MKSLKKVKTTKRKSNGFGITNFFGREQGIRSLTLKGNTDLADLTIDKFNDVELHLYGTGETGEKVVDTTRKTVSKDPAIVVEELKTQDNLTLDYRELNITVEEPLKMVKTKTGITISIDLPNVEPRPEPHPEMRPEELFELTANNHLFLKEVNNQGGVLTYNMSYTPKTVDYVALHDEENDEYIQIDLYTLKDKSIVVDLNELDLADVLVDYLVIGYSDNVNGYANILEPIQALRDPLNYMIKLPVLPVTHSYTAIIQGRRIGIASIRQLGNEVVITTAEDIRTSERADVLIERSEAQ